MTSPCVEVADAIGRAAREWAFHHRPRHRPGADRRRPRGGEADLRPADGGEDELLHRPLKSHKGYVPEGEEIYGSGKPDHKEAFDIGFGQRMTIRWCSPVRR